MRGCVIRYFPPQQGAAADRTGRAQWPAGKPPPAEAAAAAQAVEAAADQAWLASGGEPAV